ncbi:MAG: HNH endonuclease signature motif containing protein [Reyranellaceae bacterium]
MGYNKTYLLEHAPLGGRAERLVCFDVRPEGEQAASLCVVGAAGRRVIALDYVRQVSDFETGEVLAGIEQTYGGPPPLSESDIRAVRSRDKSQWHRPYLFDVIENHYRTRLFKLFGYRCFNCRKLGKLVEQAGMEYVPFWRGLDRDHHVPLSLGGRLVPGNIVILCPSCNGRKHERDPRAFYSPDQLVALRPLLAKEAEVLAFKFDPARWRDDRRAYLVSLGIGEQLAEQVLCNENHRYFVGKSSGAEPVGVALVVTGLEELLAKHVGRKRGD